mmetsp:Transcript_44807/g.112387  ORF Transcript_44807/g.112387 Transcript_44807/m.112387 type:complete len:255 (-) Transcript_44807:40-804(-)
MASMPSLELPWKTHVTVFLCSSSFFQSKASCAATFSHTSTAVTSTPLCCPFRVIPATLWNASASGESVFRMSDFRILRTLTPHGSLSLRRSRAASSCNLCFCAASSLPLRRPSSRKEGGLCLTGAPGTPPNRPPLAVFAVENVPRGSTEAEAGLFTPATSPATFPDSPSAGAEVFAPPSPPASSMTITSFPEPSSPPPARLSPTGLRTTPIHVLTTKAAGCAATICSSLPPPCTEPAPATDRAQPMVADMLDNV